MTAQTLYSFGGISATDAMGPTGVLIQGSDGNFYGATYNGGIDGGGNSPAGSAGGLTGNGTVFKVTPTGEETVLYTFAGGLVNPANPNDGANPMVLTQGSDGNLYGTTQFGGANSVGIVFKLTPDGVETVLYTFTGQFQPCGLPYNSYPSGGLIQGSDGNFYGTYASCNTQNGGGIFFKLTPAGTLTVLHTFGGAGYGIVGEDGGLPVGQVVQGSDGNFYGVTAGGGPRGLGTIYKVTPEGVETVLHSFSGPDGGSPVAGLVQGNDGNFYGVAGGTAFKITPQGVETTLYTFNPAIATNGAGPSAALIQGSDGNFYGTTADGGKDGGGTMFQLTPAGVVTFLYSFPSAPAPGYTGGFPAYPYTNLVQGSDGNLYGTAYADGAYYRGYFFKLVLSSP